MPIRTSPAVSPGSSVPASRPYGHDRQLPCFRLFFPHRIPTQVSTCPAQDLRDGVITGSPGTYRFPPASRRISVQERTAAVQRVSQHHLDIFRFPHPARGCKVRQARHFLRVEGYPEAGLTPREKFILRHMPFLFIHMYFQNTAHPFVLRQRRISDSQALRSVSACPVTVLRFSCSLASLPCSLTVPLTDLIHKLTFVASPFRHCSIDGKILCCLRMIQIRNGMAIRLMMFPRGIWYSLM